MHREKDPESDGSVGVMTDTSHTQSPEEYDLERLGRERPPTFSNWFQEFMFCCALLISMLMSEYFVSGFNIILPELAHVLDIPSAQLTWPASVFSLVIGAFLLPSGRLADIYGGYAIFNFGMVWTFVWCLVAGFSTNLKMLIATRAIAGLGPAAFLPTGVMLIGKIYRPGPRKNMVFSLYSAIAPLGFFFGIIMSGIAGQYMTWRWYFFLGAIVLLVACPMSFFAMPNDFKEAQKKNETQHVVMDWWGMATIVPALVLLTYAITDGTHAPDGWKTPYIIVTLIVGLGFLGAAVYIEGWVAKQPLLPFDLFKPKYMGRLTVALFFGYGVFGIYLLYSSLHIAEVAGKTPLITAVWFVPMAAGGIVLATIGGFTLHLLPGRILLIISGVGSILSVLLFAVIRPEATYWAFVFPAMLCATIGVDICFLVTNIFITTNLPKNRQGLAGGLVYSLLFLGISFFLGLADLAVAENKKRTGERDFSIAFWLATACAVVTLAIFSTIKLGKAESELTVEEREQLQRARAQEAASQLHPGPK
ncbi:major facilitator superfamily domain-containing protein [Rhypophila decipiens]|uniref:Major facilitator superfamily domain-containing protein n=1 Tax=Rhypophila decipiens TaxID=261697 RepID=A0AAN7BC22_9PEZI|nr:major facilitator superfamily domain-containing protein [Rhypophila decipiens]